MLLATMPKRECRSSPAQLAHGYISRARAHKRHRVITSRARRRPAQAVRARWLHRKPLSVSILTMPMILLIVIIIFSGFQPIWPPRRRRRRLLYGRAVGVAIIVVRKSGND